MTFRFVIALCSLAAAGCVMERTAPTEAPPAPTATAAPEPAQSPPPSSLPPDATVAEVPGTPTAVTPTAAPQAAPSKPSPPAPKPAAPASQAVAAAPDSAPAPVASQPPADTLDLTSLGARLRTTKAIGVLTKLSVKNQADDLLEQFRAYYKRQGTATLPDLHRSYDMLVLKLLSLLQDGDPPLAMDINRSRAAIWDILSDQRKFIDSNLMAGASL
jgi:hypothetical protein